MRMKRRTLWILVVTLLMVGCAPPALPAPPEALTAPAQEQTEDVPEPGHTPVDINVGGLRGPTGMALVGMAGAARGGQARHNYNVTFHPAPDVVQSRLINGELDIAALPTNLAALLHNRTDGEITMIAMSRMSVLYILQAPGEDIQTLEDLRGRTLLTAGQGSMQEHVMNFLLGQAGIDPQTDIDIDFQAEHPLVVALMLDGRAPAALLPQPFVTTLMAQNPEFTRALSIDDEWAAATGGIELAMSCIVVRTDFLEGNPQAVRDFLEDFAASIDFAVNQPEQAAEMIGEFEIMPQQIALAALPHSAIASVTGPEMKAAVLAYLAVLYQQNPASVGGALPDESFFFLP